jgi:hypothetical protein
MRAVRPRQGWGRTLYHTAGVCHRRGSHRSVPLIERDRVLELCSTPARGLQAGIGHKAPSPQAPRCSTQRAGIAPPHAEGDELSGVTSDGETFAFISVPAGVVGGVPLTRARNPWAMPEASTKRPQIFPWSLIPFSDVKVDPG